MQPNLERINTIMIRVGNKLLDDIDAGMQARLEAEKEQCTTQTTTPPQT